MVATCGGGTMVEEQCRESDGDKWRERQTERQTAWTPNVERERVRRFLLLGLEIGLECNKWG